jgi:hypothetical protein
MNFWLRDLLISIKSNKTQACPERDSNPQLLPSPQDRSAADQNALIANFETLNVTVIVAITTGAFII